MATLAFKPYTYVPTPPRFKSVAPGRRPAPKQASIFDKLQQIRPSGTALSTPRPVAPALAVADGDGGYRPGIRETGTIHGSSDRESDDDDRDLPTIEELLFTKLQEQGFAAAGPDPGHRERGFEEPAAEERGGSAPGDNSAGSLEDPILLQGDDDSSAPQPEVNDVGLPAESAVAAPGAGPFNSQETAIDSTAPAPTCNSDRWHDVDDFAEMAPRSRLAEQGLSMANSVPPHTPYSRHSSEPLHDSISSVDLHARRARSETTTSCSARPRSPLPRCARASPEIQLSREGRLYTGRGVSDKHGLVSPADKADPVDERGRWWRRRRQEVEQDKDEVNNKDTSSKSEHPPRLQGTSVRKCRPLCENIAILGREAIEPPQADVDLLDWEADSITLTQLKVWSRASADWDTKTLVDDQAEGLEQEVKGVAAEPMARRLRDTNLSGKADGSPIPAERQQLLPDREPSPATSYDEAGYDSHSGDELNNTKSDKGDEARRPIKRKLSSSSHDGPMHKKPKTRLQQRSTSQYKPRSKPYWRSLKSHSPLDQISRITEDPSPQARPSPPHATNTDMSPDYGSLHRSSRAALPTMAEVTFRPHSPHCCSFSAVIRHGCAERGVSFSELSRLIASIGYVGKIDDFTIKPIEQHSFLLTGFGRHTSSQPSSDRGTVSTAEGGHIHRSTTRTRPQDGRAVDAGALASRSKPSSSDDDGGLSDSDPGSSSDDDGCSSKDEQGRSSTSKHSRWSPIDEQRLLAYKKEDKPWSWIFKKFPGRTPPAVRTRWNMLRTRDE